MFSFSLFTPVSLFFLIFSIWGKHSEFNAYTISGNAQGTTFAISYIHGFSAVSRNTIDSIFASLDSNFSLYKSNSLIQKFNDHPRGIVATEDFKKLLKYSNFVSASTNGAFDISILPAALLWGKFNKSFTQAPTIEKLNEVLSYSGFCNVNLKGDSIVKNNPNLKIDLDGIAQGYSVDVIANYLDDLNIQNYLIEIGGEIRTKGSNKFGLPWKIAFVSAQDFTSTSDPVDHLEMSGYAVSTSARFSKFTSISDNKYSHIIDPRTGLTLSNNILCSTVIADQCVFTDAYDNAIMVLGIDSAFSKFGSSKHIGIHLVYKSQTGEIKDTANQYFHSFLKHAK